MERDQAISSLRTALEWLGDDVKWLAPEVDPVIEATAIAKAFDDGPAFVAERIKGYPNARYIGNLWTRRERVAKLVGVEDYRDVKHRIIRAVKHPIPPKVVSDADPRIWLHLLHGVVRPAVRQRQMPHRREAAA